MKIWHSRRASTVAAVILLIGTIAFMQWLGGENEKLRRKHEYAFPDLQKAAFTLHPMDKAKTILEKWHVDGVDDPIGSTMKADLAFPLFYAALLSLLAWWAHLRRTKPWVIRLGRWSAVAALISGLADWGENAAMLWMLGDSGKAAGVFVMLPFTWIKSLALMLALYYVVLSHLDS